MITFSSSYTCLLLKRQNVQIGIIEGLLSFSGYKKCRVFVCIGVGWWWAQYIPPKALAEVLETLSLSLCAEQICLSVFKRGPRDDL